jgi:hypothetical protein
MMSESGSKGRSARAAKSGELLQELAGLDQQMRCLMIPGRAPTL